MRLGARSPGAASFAFRSRRPGPGEEPALGNGNVPRWEGKVRNSITGERRGPGNWLEELAQCRPRESLYVYNYK